MIVLTFKDYYIYIIEHIVGIFSKYKYVIHETSR